MKNTSAARPTGFTLIELLIVITIIAILAGLAVPAANMVMQKAKETQAKVMIVGLVNAVKSYQTEYNRLPDPIGTSAETTVNTDSSNGVIKILLGKDSTFNPRAIVFFDPPTAKNSANGLIITGSDPSATYALVDTWSTPTKLQYFHMAFDYSGDLSIPNPMKTGANSAMFKSDYIAAQPDTLRGDVIVYSDNDPSMASSKRKPVTSW